MTLLRKRGLAGLLVLSLALGGCSIMPSWLGGKKNEKEKEAGERIAALPVDAALSSDAAVGKVAFVLPPATANADWPQHNGETSGVTGNLAATEFSTIVDSRAGKGDSFLSMLAFRPVVGGGAVFAMDAVGHISAHNAADIRKDLWQSDGVVDSDETQITGGGLAFNNGHLYAASERGIVAAFDAATGKTLWSKALRVPFMSAPRVEGDKLFVTTLDNQLYALNTATGDVVWNHRGISEAAGLMVSISPVPMTGDAIMVPYSSGELYTLAASDGKVLWSDSLTSDTHTQATAMFSGIGGDPIVDGEAMFAVSTGGQMTAFYLPTGRRIWQLPIGSINSPWLAGDYIYVLTTDNVVVCLVKYNGKIRWSTPLPSYEKPADRRDPIVWKGPVVVSGKVAVVSSNGQLELLDAGTGKNTLTVTVPDGIASSPVIAGGKMYLVSQSAKLYELQ